MFEIIYQSTFNEHTVLFQRSYSKRSIGLAIFVLASIAGTVWFVNDKVIVADIIMFTNGLQGTFGLYQLLMNLPFGSFRLKIKVVK